MNINSLYRSKFRRAILFLIAVLLIGVLGYRYIANYNWVDALYMAKTLARSYANEFQSSHFSAPQDPEFFSIARYPNFDELI